MIRSRRSHIPSLPQLSSLAEGNYVRLQKLLPDSKAGTQLTFSLSNGSHKGMRISVTIDEIHRYTTMLTIQQREKLAPGLKGPRMQVRMYHDAGMAEVVRYQDKQVNQGTYQYPNPAMFQPDEKTQLNRFLADCLEHCLQHGHAEMSDWFTDR